ncbi:MAG: Ubiquinone biosynthesis O-methyltransferase [Pseudomonadota bacterium]
MVANYHSHVRHNVFPLVPRGGKVLDFGGGDGATAAALKAAGHVECVGVADLVPPDPAHAIDFSYQGDLSQAEALRRIGADHGPFDTILCLDILEHLIDPWSTVGQLHGMLKPGGCIVASVPNVRHYSVLLPLLAGHWRYRDAEVLDRTHLRFFTRDTAVELMMSSGLALEAVIPNPRERRRDQWLQRLTGGLFSGVMALQYLIRVRNGDTAAGRGPRP